MEIKAADVAKLRKMTGAGMMDCKKALIEAEGDYARAQDIIREKGKLVAAKRADRQTTEGKLVAAVNADNTQAAMTCLGCETDFVSKNEEFTALAQAIAQTALANLPENMEALLQAPVNGTTVEQAITEQTGKTGEKHSLAFYNKIEAPYVGAYIHTNFKVGSIVGFNKVVPAQLAKEVAMQITAMNPVAISRDTCPAEVIEKEMNIYREQIRMEGKPENMVDRIAEGKLNKFFKESTLEDQDFVQADDKKSVKQHIQSVDKDAKVVAFYRFSLND